MKCLSYKDFFLNFANDTNIDIIFALQEGPKSVKVLVEKIGREQSATSHSLRKLSDCNIVKAKQKGRERIYTLNSDTIKPLLKLVEEHVEKKCTRCKHV